MSKAKPIYTIGHKNPDTDSICSAIGYAHLKQALGENVIPARAGKINAETKFVLSKFKVKSPMLIEDFYPRVKDVMLPFEAAVKESDSLRKLGEIMRKHNLKSVPVVDDTANLLGIVTVSDLAKRYFTELSMQNLTDAGVTFESIIKVIDGEVVVGSGIEKEIQGSVRIAAGSSNTIQKIIKSGDIVLVGDRTDGGLIDCLNQKIACLVVTSAGRVPSEVIELAEQRNILVVSTPHDTYTCARLVNQCVPVSTIMKKDPTSFKATDMLSDIKEAIKSTQFRNYPVVENNRIIGIVNRGQLIIPERERVILVDHNERNQAVEGIEETKIIEIIDHHRLGGIQTSEPIFTRQEPVGCTATIVANMHWHRDIAIPADIAGLLLSAIISDTVLFKSPTCTAKDKETALRLAEISNVDIMEYGMEMLKAGSGIGDMTAMEIAKNDLKEFKISEYRLIVSQISVMDPDEVLHLKDDLLACMENICSNEGYDMSLLMITDIIKEGTHLLFIGSPRTLIGEAFSKDASSNLIYLPGVMSRKKQIIPPLVEAAAQK